MIMSTAYKKQIVAAALALSLGLIGAHAWYLARPRAWLWTALSGALIAAALFQPVWWDNIWAYLLWLPATVAVVESVVLALAEPAHFRARYGHPQGVLHARGWSNILVALAALVIGGTVLLYWLAMIMMAGLRMLGWLDVSAY